MNRTYKSNFYNHYFTSHLAHRKGVTSRQTLESEAPIWREHFGGLLPGRMDAKIVDVGCGDGSLVWWMRSVGYNQAEGIEISEELVEIARGLGIGNVRQADLRKFLRAKRGVYDVIILRDVLEHFRKEEIIEILKLCRRAMADAGRLIIQVPNAESPFFGRIRYGDFTHEVAFSATSVQQVFTMVGLVNIRLFPSGGPVVQSAKSFLRFLAWKLVEALYKILLYAEIGRGQRIVTHDLIAVGEKGAGRTHRS
jgi:2-polyprenyl-3-methyl-5-hydroxy-6-metoxy-1,4-benzoquinol methylase